ncbi:hypothetical protein LOC68_06680 [Blastopirellula sp. JC732]|uniref:ATPase BadF/BadG/BcrA/BcrD type domain-containing protein n=1 Tax=Blastopirellula sediminis TaxID=2894196 RepID=A0A9X1MJS7_9BACT|nr:BadF/BadG/BcrA/BcrD ATPase family protein [Blastopirellula sediminis]MCC9609149.1 hypothetical protein [Blastopirellula sediminis]MCC9628074.1 hypothetical protein [Blastopirellula sediminis]
MSESESAAGQRDLFLGVDGGGTKTSCYVGAAGPSGQIHILGRGASTGSNPRTAGIDNAVAAILESVQRAKEDAGFADSPCQRGLFAIAGTLDLTFRRELAARLAAAQIANRCDVVPDLVPLLGSETGSTIAIGIIAGTGSVGIGRDAAGQIAILGGWGPLLGDEGSGFEIGKHALRNAAGSLELGAGIDSLTEIVCDQLRVQTAEEIRALLAANADQRGLIASLAKCVIEAAASGEPVAGMIVDQAIDSLATLVENLRQRVQSYDAKLDESPLPLTLSGSLFQSSIYFREKFERRLCDWGIVVAIRILEDPTFACLELAARGEFTGELRFLR